jgi:RNA polymerase sigma-70 factor (ECF subfamily)
MHKRAQQSRPRLVDEDRGPVPEELHTPEDEAARNLRVSAFRRVLDQLSEKKRTVFVLHELEGISPKEIAEIVDAPVLTVRTRLFYARREVESMAREEPLLAAVFAEAAPPSSSQGPTLRKRTI